MYVINTASILNPNATALYQLLRKKINSIPAKKKWTQAVIFSRFFRIPCFSSGVWSHIQVLANDKKEESHRGRESDQNQEPVLAGSSEEYGCPTSEHQHHSDGLPSDLKSGFLCIITEKIISGKKI